MKKRWIVPKNHCGGAAATPTQAVRVGDVIVVGGQMSLDEKRNVVGFERNRGSQVD